MGVGGDRDVTLHSPIPALTRAVTCHVAFLARSAYFPFGSTWPSLTLLRGNMQSGHTCRDRIHSQREGTPPAQQTLWVAQTPLRAAPALERHLSYHIPQSQNSQSDVNVEPNGRIWNPAAPFASWVTLDKLTTSLRVSEISYLLGFLW